MISTILVAFLILFIVSIQYRLRLTLAIRAATNHIRSVTRAEAVKYLVKHSATTEADAVSTYNAVMLCPDYFYTLPCHGDPRFYRAPEPGEAVLNTSAQRVYASIARNANIARHIFTSRTHSIKTPYVTTIIPGWDFAGRYAHLSVLVYMLMYYVLFVHNPWNNDGLLVILVKVSVPWLLIHMGGEFWTIHAILWTMVLPALYIAAAAPLTIAWLTAKPVQTGARSPGVVRNIISGGLIACAGFLAANDGTGVLKIDKRLDPRSIELNHSVTDVRTRDFDFFSHSRCLITDGPTTYRVAR